MSADARDSPTLRSHPQRRLWLGAALVICLLTSLLWSRLMPAGDPVFATLAAARFEGYSWATVGAIALRMGEYVIAAMPVGYVLALSLADIAARGISELHPFLRKVRREWWRRWCFIWLPAFAATCMWLWFLHGLAPGNGARAPGFTALPLSVLGSALGASLGCATPRGAGGVLRWFAKLGIGIFMVLAGGAFIVALAVRAAPLDVTDATITSAEKRHLVYVARDANPLHVGAGAVGVLQLQPQDVRALLAWSALVVDPHARVQVSSRANALAFAWSAEVGGGRFINVSGRIHARVAGGSLRADDCSLRLGALGVSGRLCGLALRAGYWLIARDPNFSQALSSIVRIEVGANGCTALYRHLDVGEDLHGALLGLLGPAPNVRVAVAAQFEALRRSVLVIRNSADPLATAFAVSFGLARQRAGENDARADNQAAILALATLFGHQDVATLSGLAAPAYVPAMQHMLGQPTLRNRSDWTRHFLVSAAITQMSSAVLSDAAGVLKEELDADGGSGFSFGDLLADRAGTRFGQVATRDVTAARTVQTLMVKFKVDDILPDGADLPEGIQDAQLQAVYGGVGGATYKRIVASIEARLDACRAYRSSGSGA